MARLEIHSKSTSTESRGGIPGWRTDDVAQTFCDEIETTAFGIGYKVGVVMWKQLQPQLLSDVRELSQWSSPTFRQADLRQEKLHGY